MASMQKNEPQADSNFKIEEFRKILFETKEGSMLQLMMASDQSTAQAKKIPQEVLFIDWHDGHTYTYKEA